MIVHRLGTLFHIVATTKFNWFTKGTHVTNERACCKRLKNTSLKRTTRSTLEGEENISEYVSGQLNGERAIPSVTNHW